MFSANLKITEKLKQVFDSIGNDLKQTQCAILNISNEGIKILSGESFGGVSVELFLDKKIFFEWDLKKDRDLKKILDIRDLIDMIAITWPEDVIAMKADDCDFTFAFELKNERPKSLTEKLYDVEKHEEECIDTKCSMSLTATELKGIYEDLKRFGDELKISCSTMESVDFTAVRNKENTASFPILREAANIQVNKFFIAQYDFEDFNKILRTSSISEQDTLSIREDNILVLQNQVSDFGHIEYCLDQKEKKEEIKKLDPVEIAKKMNSYTEKLQRIEKNLKLFLKKIRE